jgi:hypothetical protein
VIPLRRTNEPRVLAENRDKWLEKFREKRAATPGHRPPSSQYAHEDIVLALEAMSFKKCFYCEALAESREVDHYVEVAEQPERAFIWENLYLSCKLCQSKARHQEIAVTDCLDPCDPAVAPRDHLDFIDEQIRAKNDSPVGSSTIRKYRLHDDRHDHRRLKQLKLLLKEHNEILRTAMAEHREMTAAERTSLRRYRSREHPYSLMFDIYLARMGL